MIRQGAATRDGRGEAVTAIVYLLAGENGRVVVDRIKEKVEEIQKDLPEGVVIDPYYDRSALIEKTIDTVAHNLAEGGVLVVAVLLVLLGNLRAGLIVALAIPLSMLFAGNLMLDFGIAGSLMSLGRDRLRPDRRQRGDRDRELRQPPGARRPERVAPSRSSAGRPWRSAGRSSSAWRSSRWSTCRCWRLQGVEGKMFRPMALTVIFALTGSLLLSLTATPVLASFFLKPGIVGARHPADPAGPSGCTSRSCGWSLRHPVGGRARRPWPGSPRACRSALGLGGEFIPQLDEGDLVIVQTRPAERLARRGDRRLDPPGDGPARGLPGRDPHGGQPDRPARDRPGGRPA